MTNATDEAGGALDAAAIAFSRRIGLIVAVAFFMESLDGSIVATALPAIAHSFDQPALTLTLGITVYLVALGACVPAAGWASDRFGSRSVFASAIGVFTLASLLCGLSLSPLTFFLARALQGAAAAFMSPVGRLVVLAATPKQYIIEAITLITWPGLIAPVVGPPLAGFLATYASWRWIFFINVPLGMLGTLLVWRLVPGSSERVQARFDSVGFVLTAGAFALLVQGLSILSADQTRWPLGAGLLLGGILGGVLSWRHARRVPFPMLDLRAMSVPSFTLSTVTAGTVSRTAINTVPFLLPLMFQIGFQMRSFDAGLMLVPYMIGNLAMKTVTTALLRRFGFYQLLAVNGALCALAIGSCALLDPLRARTLSYVILLAAGMTRSMHFSCVNSLAFADLTPAQRPGASTLTSMLSQLASTLGVAFGACALALSQDWRDSAHPGVIDFRIALLAAGVLMGISTLWTLRLPPHAGVEIARRR
jgi:MFS family permease